MNNSYYLLNSYKEFERLGYQLIINVTKNLNQI